jgi:DNA-directed RNA polymerase subunit M/transcription elongation factor TFIIS
MIGLTARIVRDKYVDKKMANWLKVQQREVSVGEMMSVKEMLIDCYNDAIYWYQGQTEAADM